MPNNEFGDFQTPLELALQCLRILAPVPNSRILEPTCGLGSFLEASSLIEPLTERVGIEINPIHAESASSWGHITVGNVFDVDLGSDVLWNSSGPLYVVGNPPWVTSAELQRMGSGNLPQKSNFKGAKGLAALLGSSNFDVSEFVILKCLSELSGQPLRLGMLCKTQVARNVTEHASATGLPISSASIYRIDAMRWFGAAVDSCLFVVEADSTLEHDYTVSVYKDVFAPGSGRVNRFGMVDGRFVSDVDGYNAVRGADGTSRYVWRSGMKHDAARVFELMAVPEPAVDGKPLDVESEYLYPLLKSTDIFRGKHSTLRRWVIVPQRTFGEDTQTLRVTAPKLWDYLESHSAVLDGRKSSIYRNRPRFSVFGHGDYTFSPYKVAISGLHKEAVFRVVSPIEGRPVVLDDTCYFVPFDDPAEAFVFAAKLNSPEAQALIASLVFWDSKRPITKKLLSRIDVDCLSCDVELVVAAAMSSALEAGVEIQSDRVHEYAAGMALVNTSPAL